MPSFGSGEASGVCCSILAAGSFSVNAVPTPTVLSTRILPWCCFDDFAAHRQANARAAFAARVGAVLGRVVAIEDPRQFVGGMPDPESRTVRSTVSVAGSWRDANENPPTARHRLPGIGQQIEQHLLNLVAAHERQRRRLGSELDLHAIFLHLALQEHERFLDELGQVGRHAVVAAIAGEAQHAVGDFFGPQRGVEDFRERLVARRLRLCAAGRAWRS